MAEWTLVYRERTIRFTSLFEYGLFQSLARNLVNPIQIDWFRFSQVKSFIEKLERCMAIKFKQNVMVYHYGFSQEHLQKILSASYRSINIKKMRYHLTKFWNQNDINIFLSYAHMKDMEELQMMLWNQPVRNAIILEAIVKH